jgi:hypothetical protein
MKTNGRNNLKIILDKYSNQTSKINFYKKKNDLKYHMSWEISQRLAEAIHTSFCKFFYQTNAMFLLSEATRARGCSIYPLSA